MLVFTERVSEGERVAADLGDWPLGRRGRRRRTEKIVMSGFCTQGITRCPRAASQPSQSRQRTQM